jgi:hypothetical protein
MTGGTAGVGKATTVSVVAGSGGGDRRRLLRHADHDCVVMLMRSS